MPELPEVENICRMLREKLVGHEVTDVTVHLPRVIRNGDINTLVGASFKNIYRCGKYICFDMDNGLMMYSHFRMTGTFLWKNDLAKTPTHIRVEFELENGTLLFRDIRTFGGIWIKSDGSLPWKKLGIDPFDQEFTVTELQARLGKRKQPIKQVILDQALIAGLGNIYASEVLFEACIHPLRHSNKLKKTEIKKLHDAIIKVLSAAINAGGTTFRDFQLSNGKSGAFQQFLQVYARKDKSCRICGKPIEKIVLGQRSTYFCSECQK
ncbi:MAG: bifunctional DNA-formamidopyrimidine glycosylase/DNA-(apurinic or apyrimidinic site) lyase [Calditrichaeota bacterium]|nr:bifunctional DNA-formamidopyrimidine glycosylase/DNA-(apurinic or apyrimidinic site) lyase [Calditrichota bacterium]